MSGSSRAMIAEGPGRGLAPREVPVPQPSSRQILVRVSACGICRTDLHLIDGELAMARYPVVPGHQIVGRVERNGSEATRFTQGQRVGIPWLGWTCGECRHCRSGDENLCRRALFTGCHLDGGYAEWAVADERYCFPIPDSYAEIDAAPLLCAGLIGYRALRIAGEGPSLGLYGFGASAHIVAQIARHQGRRLFAFTRPGDERGQQFARELGAEWVGGSGDAPPEPLDAVIIFAPVGALVPEGLRVVRDGGRVVCAGIQMSDIPSFPYALLWGERRVQSVANLTRRDGEEFFEIAPKIPVKTRVTTFSLDRANEALDALRRGTFEGAAVLVP